MKFIFLKLSLPQHAPGSIAALSDDLSLTYGSKYAYRFSKRDWRAFLTSLPGYFALGIEGGWV